MLYPANTPRRDRAAHLHCLSFTVALPSFLLILVLLGKYRTADPKGMRIPSKWDWCVRYHGESSLSVLPMFLCSNHHGAAYGQKHEGSPAARRHVRDPSRASRTALSIIALFCGLPGWLNSLLIRRLLHAASIDFSWSEYMTR